MSAFLILIAYYWLIIFSKTGNVFRVNKEYNVYKYDILNIPTSDCISKYKLLNIMKEVFETNIKIKENSDVTIEKCLLKTDNMSNIDIKTQLEELKEFYYDN